MRLNSFINKKKFLRQYRSLLLLLAPVAMGMVLLVGCKSKQITTTDTSIVTTEQQRIATEANESAVFFNQSPAVQLQIHHIYVNNGDATVIRLLHANGTETKVLIDGGQTSYDTYLKPYFETLFHNRSFDYTILTHYHNDHYKGLEGIGSTSNFISKNYIDLGGYNMQEWVLPQLLEFIQPKDTTSPWVNSDGIFQGQIDKYFKSVGKAAQWGLTRYGPMDKVANNIKDLVGVQIPLGEFSKNGRRYPIILRCVAAWGWTQANNAVQDDWNPTGGVKNDPCLAFVLECGEFRYFLGGDMGGSDDGNYIDQESTLVAGFSYLYPTPSKSYFNVQGPQYAGHICGFKANHHGSKHSNNSTFLNAMHPAVCVTSCGSNTGFAFPNIPFLERLNATIPVTTDQDLIDAGLPINVGAQGFYFTTLKNYTKGRSLTKAKKLFDTRPKTFLEYGQGKNPPNPALGYVVSANLDNVLVDYTERSVFSVHAITPQYEKGNINFFYCHKK